MERLPPLNQFQAFEAAARNLSFSRAADELNVQQPAISRQIANIEQNLGAKLFVRTKPLLTLTKEGETLFSAVSSGIGTIHSAVNEISKVTRNNVITVNAAIGFTSMYLLPRLGEFQDRFPDIKLEIVTRDQNPDYDLNQCDCIVVFGMMGIAGLRSQMVLQEELVPVCAPGFLADDMQLEKRDLPEFSLLHMTSPDHRYDWHIYLEGSGIEIPEPDPLNRILSYMVYLRAIQNGNGIGLGWGRLTDDLVASGNLVIACDERIKTDRGYHCCITQRAEQNTGAAAFTDWLAGLINQPA